MQTGQGYAKISVTLLLRHVALLDQLAIDIRMRHQVALSRSALIRAVIEFAEATDLKPAPRQRRVK
jgi:hypothetical protein